MAPARHCPSFPLHLFAAVCLLLLSVCWASAVWAQGMQPGEMFTDTLRSGGEGPEMVVIPPEPSVWAA